MIVTDSEKLYEYSLQQMAAEAYFEEIDLQTRSDLEERLRLGTNRRGYRSGLDSLNEGWPGFTRLTDPQIDELLQKFTIIHQWSDDVSHAGHPRTSIYDTVGAEIQANTGLSATLLKDKRSGEYTLAIRSTESREWGDGNSSPDGRSVGGGDRPRDGIAADVYGVVATGFSLAQQEALDQYYGWLRRSGRLPDGAVLNVTGYSLGGHLATVFAEMHEDSGVRLGDVVTFNGAGRGNWDDTRGDLRDVMQYYRTVLNNPSAGHLAEEDRPSPLAVLDAMSKLGAFGAATGLVLATWMALADPLGDLEAAATATETDVFPDFYIYGDIRYVWAVVSTYFKYDLRPAVSPHENAVGVEVAEVSGFEPIGSFNVVADSQNHGTRVKVAVESQPYLIDSDSVNGDDYDYGSGHSIVLISDSLALQRVLHRLDDSITLESFVPLLKAATYEKPVTSVDESSNYEVHALENLLDGIRRQVLGPDVADTPAKSGGGGFGDWSSRDQFHANLQELESTGILAELAGKVDVRLVDTSLAERAWLDFGAVLALHDLSPICLRARSDSRAEVEAVLAVRNADLYAKWREDAERGEAIHFTEMWCRSRAALLEGMRRVNEENIQPDGEHFELEQAIPGLIGAWRVTDLASGVHLDSDDRFGTPHQLFFGSSDGDAVVGAASGDRLFGGMGRDTLSGREGTDYLEGGDGDDVLEGGRGNDLLVGGAGVDLYRWRTGDGNDRIVELDEADDSRGGLLELNGRVISVVHRYQQTPLYEAGGFLFSDMQGSSLRVFTAGTQPVLVIDNFDRETNNLGIRFEEASSDPVPPLQPPELEAMPRDPLVVDLDGDGLETVGLIAGVHFDHGGDGVAEGSGWIGGDDALLVRDLDGDGLITGGAELFGNFTRMRDGRLADDGFAALADLDRDGDGWVDAAEGTLRLWRDRNQNGLTDAGELLTLHQAGIAALSTDGSRFSQRQADGNMLRGTSVARTTDGRTLGTGIYDFLSSPLQRRFTEAVSVPTELEVLPDMRGTGAVRDLREAAALSPVLAALLSRFVAGDAALQREVLDEVLTAWAESSSLVLEGQSDREDRLVEHVWAGAAGQGLAADLPTLTLVLADGQRIAGPAWWREDAFTEEQRVLQRQFRVVEYFSGQAIRGWQSSQQRIVGVEGDASSTDFPANGFTLASVGLAPAGVETVRRNWNEMREALYRGLVLQTRLSPYLELVEWSIDEGGNACAGFDALDARLATGDDVDFSVDTLSDVVDLYRCKGEEWGSLGWRGEDILRQWMQRASEAGDSAEGERIRERLTLLGVGYDGLSMPAEGALLVVGRGAADIIRGGALADQLLGGSGDDQLLAGAGNDFLRGGDGADMLSGEGGDDHFIGGLGDDVLNGGTGVDRYDYSRGDGDDVLHASLDAATLSRLVFGTGIKSADVMVRRDGNDLLSMIDGGGSVRVAGFFDGRGVTIAFADDAQEWDLQAILDLVQEPTRDDDVLEGYSWRSDTLHGEGGNDQLSGYGGNDLLDGGEGRDVLDGGLDDDWLEGGAGNDMLYGREGQDHLAGGEGDDRLYGDDGNDDLEGGAGADTLFGAFGNDSLEGGDGNDTVYGDDGNDILLGGAGRDRLLGGNGSDQLFGGDGDDELRAGAGDDHVEGNAGDDLIAMSRQGVIVYRRGDGHDSVGYSTVGEATEARLAFVDIEFAEIEVWREGLDGLRLVVAGSMDGVTLQDVSYAAPVSRVDFADGRSVSINELVSLAPVTDGPDEVRFVGGQYLALQLGDGADIATGSPLADWVDGGAGSDLLSGGDGPDVMVGGEGSDQLLGEEGDDDLSGDGDDILHGGAGNDILHGAGEQYGDDGADVLRAPETAALLAGGAGSDRLFGDRGDDILHGDDGNDRVQGGAGADVIDGGEGDDLLMGEEGADHLRGGEGRDTLQGGLDRDWLEGGTDDDELQGDDGDDVLVGDAGNDWLVGGMGLDTLSGGAGDDHFVADPGEETVIEDVDGGVIHIPYLVAPGVPPPFALFFGDGSGAVTSLADAERLSPAVRVTYDPAAGRMSLTGRDDLTTLTIAGLAQAVPEAVPDFTLDFGGPLLDAAGFAVRSGVFSLRELLASPTAPGLEANPDSVDIGALEADVTGNLLLNDHLVPGRAGWITSASPITGQWGVLDIAADGTFRYSPSEAAMMLADGAQVVDVFPYTVADGIDSASSELTVTLRGSNHRPRFLASLPDVQGVAGMPFAVELPEGVATDPDPGDVLSWRVLPSDEAEELPDWLQFDASRRLLSGAPGLDVAGEYVLLAVVTDPQGASASRAFGLSIGAALPDSGQVILGSDRDDILEGTPGNDVLDGGPGGDLMQGGAGDDTYRVDRGSLRRWTGAGATDRVLELPDAGRDMIESSSSVRLPAHVEDLRLDGRASLFGIGNGLANWMQAGAGGDRLKGLGGDDILQGGIGDDRLSGGAGVDILQGGGGDDWLRDSVDNGLLDGGEGADRLTGGPGDNLLVGGQGNDVIATGGGADLLAFNRGDGSDTVHLAGGGALIISLGGGIAPADLTLFRERGRLVLDCGEGDRINLADAGSRLSGRSGTLQLQLLSRQAPAGADTLAQGEAMVQALDLRRASTALEPQGSPRARSVSTVALEALLEPAVPVQEGLLGGEAAWRYGMAGTMAGLPASGVLAQLAAPAFGRQPQLIAAGIADSQPRLC